MAAQVFGSVYVGLFVSAVLFLPLVLWQYRRYGRFDGMRMLWTTAGFVYLAAIVAFTVFPLPDFSGGYCSAHATSPLLDPFRFPREFVGIARRDGLLAAATDGAVWEVALNVVLFIPFGLIVRRVLEWPRAVVFMAALCTSLMIEATQLTGNWGLAPCSYRFADTTDLITNSTGALLGIGLERITPRLLSTKAHLQLHRDRARPVTRGRRMLGMLLDAWYFGCSLVIGGTIGSTWFRILQDVPYEQYSAQQMLSLERAILSAASIAAALLVLLPAIAGTGASLGQRTVYLAPTHRRRVRLPLILRAASVQGVGVWTFSLGLPWALLGVSWGGVALLSVLVSARGLSCLLTGCGMHDARASRPVDEAITYPNRPPCRR